MLTKKEDAALARLEAERNRRRDERIGRGAAVRVRLLIVAGASSSVDVANARERKLKELRRDGEVREIYWDEMVIITGVPRPGREPDNYKPPAEPEAAAPSIMSRRIMPPPAFREDVPQKAPSVADEQIPARRIFATVERPSEKNPAGVIAEGWYRVVGGLVKVEDVQGNLLGTAPIKPSDDVEAAARKILREKKVSAFYGPISYPKLSMH